jgi:hypothetical protein
LIVACRSFSSTLVLAFHLGAFRIEPPGTLKLRLFVLLARSDLRVEEIDSETVLCVGLWPGRSGVVGVVG